MNKATMRECNLCGYKSFFLKDDAERIRNCRYCKGTLEVYAQEDKEVKDGD